MTNTPQSRDEEEINKLSNLTNSLGELSKYLSIEYSLLGVMEQRRVAGILERTANALDAGATAREIKEAFKDYIPEWNPDRTAG
jgi:hypothetical protein